MKDRIGETACRRMFADNGREITPVKKGGEL